MKNKLLILLVAVPAAAVVDWVQAPAVWIFAVASLAIIPLAALMGRATESLASHAGEGVGGLLNATFGNLAELILALMALRAGLYAVVKASITGSIICNILLVLGGSLVAGGLNRPIQRFNRTAAGLSATLLQLAAAALVIPALFHAVATVSGSTEHELSLEISVVLFVVYLASLVFTFKTHPHLYQGESSREDHVAEWSTRVSILVLAVSTLLVTWMSHILVGAVEGAAHTLGMTEVFVGVVLVAVIGNAAEHSSAILAALNNRMDLSLQIALGSSLQIALFVAPFLVFASRVVGPAPLDLVFTPFEVAAVVLSVIVAQSIVSDGESNWMEGVLLLSLYLILGIGFYLLP